MRIKIICLVPFFLLFMSCEKQQEDAVVKNYGALRQLMSGDLSPTVSLDSLSQLQHLYALGAYENLNGEIQIFDSNSFNSIEKDGSVIIDATFKPKASLLVHAQVPSWVEFKIPLFIKTYKDLETFVKEQAQLNGWNMQKPFVFLIEGKVKRLDWHVINWKLGDTIHTHQKHKIAGLNGSVKNEPIQLLGFYSENHKGIFTHHSTFMHMHFKNNEETLAGHVDDILLSKSMILKLPKQ